ncbi:MAG: SUMF1/EgtB/PvdO family nonheme iron enzyme [Spirochaetota bacterium]
MHRTRSLAFAVASATFFVACPSLGIDPGGGGSSPGYRVLKMVDVVGGTFSMGSDSEGVEGKPVHKVTVGDFSMSETEVTVAQWNAIMSTSAQDATWTNIPIAANWFSATAFCNALSAHEGLQSVYSSSSANVVTADFSKNGFRLPTEAEWEFAARGGLFSYDYQWSGAETMASAGWNATNSGGSLHEVAKMTENELGIYDMSGNIAEWCYDYYGDYPLDAQVSPKGPSTGSSRVVRGGSIESVAAGCTVTSRDQALPAMASAMRGFRVVRRTNATSKSLAPDPVSIVVASSGDKVVYLSWTESEAASSYSVYYKTNSTVATRADNLAPSSMISGTTATIPNLNNGTSFAFVVTAGNAYGESDISAPVSVTPGVRLLNMLPVGEGSFKMGSGPGLPGHDVSLGFFTMSSTEITQGQYLTVMGNNPALYSSDTTRPVEGVSWFDAVEFCNKLSLKEGLSVAYAITNRVPADGYPISSATVVADFAASGYRLPTEAQWEYAARGGFSSKGYTYAGSNSLDKIGWYQKNSLGIDGFPVTHPVAGLNPNELGFYDLCGNVGEWVWDWDSTLATVAEVNPTGPISGSYRIYKGGSITEASDDLAVNARPSIEPQTRENYIGFRVIAPVATTVTAQGRLVETPVFSIPEGVLSADTTVTITSKTPTTKIRYTWSTTGVPSDPTVTSPELVGGIPVKAGVLTVIKAIGSAEGYSNSGIATITYNPLLAMLEVTGGTFNNGRGDVTVSGFVAGNTEITQDQYKFVTSSSPSKFDSSGLLPVEQVTWYDAVEFCNLLSIREGRPPVYTITSRTPATGYPITSAGVTMDIMKSGYRLPTEAEWEFAARGGNSSGNFTYAGSGTIDSVAWYNYNSNSTTHVVAGMAANELGFSDMSGNVWEWCWDWYADFPTAQQTDPTGSSTGTARTLRGGSYMDYYSTCTVTNRYPSYTPDLKGGNVGFRVVRRK